MPFEHPSGLPSTYDRAASGPNRARLLFPEGAFMQGADLNEAQSIIERRSRRVGDMVARDGDRIDGAGITVDTEAGTVSLAAGRIYVRGDVRPVAAATLNAVPMTGEIVIGVRLVTVLVTAEDDPSLYGLEPGSLAEGEPGAARQEETIAWARADVEADGDFYGVYVLRDGTVIDQTPPPSLSGVNAAIALYDRQAHGHYIVDGCEVTALGKIGADWVYSIGAGVANISGFKRTREASLRHAETEAVDLQAIAAEPRTFVADGAAIAVLQPPIAAVTAAVVVKQVTESVVRGGVAGGLDLLGHTSVVSIQSVTQGATTFAVGTYALAGNSISWAPAGAEPAAASSYSVTYRYNEAVTPDSVTPETVTLSGGVPGTTALISYTSKLPRIDLLCLDELGRPAYVKGLSARSGAVPPIAPTALLALAEIHNTWLTRPTIRNNGVHNLTYAELQRMLARLIDVMAMLDRAESARDILEREPVSKRGIFTDNFQDDFYRDQGEAQTAAAGLGILQLAVDPIALTMLVSEPVTLDHTEAIVLRQEARTGSMKINPYINTTRMPAALKLEPPVDFWVERETAWTSSTTIEFASGASTAAAGSLGESLRRRTGTTGASASTATEVVAQRTERAEVLREIEIAFEIRGFAAGEALALLTFDGVDVTPPGPLTADAFGIVAGTFDIPPGTPAGSKRVRAVGSADSAATALFVGEGTILVDVLRRVTLVPRQTPPAVETTTSEGAAGGGNGADPLAQTFALDQARMILGFDVVFTVKGNPDLGVRLQLATVENGIPTGEVLAEAYVDMHSVVLNVWHPIRFAVPVYIPAGVFYAPVLMTDDPDHAVAIARIGEVDTVTGAYVSAQPYTVGVLLSSSNRSTWTPHQFEDLAFRVVAAAFAPTTKTVALGSHALTTISDILIRAGVELPTAAASLRFEVSRPTGEVLQLAPDQVAELAAYITETVTVRAILAGSETIAPILYAAQMITGRIRTTGTYVSRAFPMGTGIRVGALFAALLPAGATVTVEADAADDSWHALTAGDVDSLGGGWTEPAFERDPHTAVQGRIRLSLAGGPGARPRLARLRAWSI